VTIATKSGRPAREDRDRAGVLVGREVRPALARTWKPVKKPMIVVTSMR
jgi:hypothetical protein